MENKIRLITGIFLWVISAILTFNLYLGIGDGSFFNTFFLAFVAIALEATKILTWRMGGKVRILSVILIIISAIASLLAAFQTVEDSKNTISNTVEHNFESSPIYIDKSQKLLSFDKEIEIQLNRLAVLPPDFVTAAGRITETIKELRNSRSKTSQEIQDALKANSYTPKSISDNLRIFSHTIGFPPESFLLVLLLIVAGSIEAGALVLCSPITRKKIKSESPVVESDAQEMKNTTSSGESLRPTLSHRRPITHEDFLVAAKKDSDLPFLNGRDKTATILGIKPGEAKKIVQELISDGKVIVEGKRLCLVDRKEDQ